MPLYGSGPFNNTSGSGFYTVDQYKEILRYAQERHVEVIPEIDMPDPQIHFADQTIKYIQFYQSKQ